MGHPQPIRSRGNRNAHWLSQMAQCHHWSLVALHPDQRNRISVTRQALNKEELVLWQTSLRLLIFSLLTAQPQQTSAGCWVPPKPRRATHLSSPLHPPPVAQTALFRHLLEACSTDLYPLFCSLGSELLPQQREYISLLIVGLVDDVIPLCNRRVVSPAFGTQDSVSRVTSEQPRRQGGRGGYTPLPVMDHHQRVAGDVAKGLPCTRNTRPGRLRAAVSELKKTWFNEEKELSANLPSMNTASK